MISSLNLKIAAAITLMVGTAQAGTPIPPGDSWAASIGTTRTLETDHLACSTQRALDLAFAIHRQPGMEMDLPCTLLLRGYRVTIVSLEYGCAYCFAYAYVRWVDDQTNYYWVAATAELLGR
jgi:hypothetical protein